MVPTGRRRERLDELAALITAAGGSVHPIALDMEDHESIIGAVAEAEEAVGTVTILVNNAGIPDAQRAHKMSIELIDQVLDTNLRGPYILSCEVARRLIAAELPGRMVNISSIGAYSYSGNGAALYSISKAAIVADDGGAGGRVGPLPHQRERHRPRRVRVGDDGRDDRAHGRLHQVHFPRKRMGDPAQLDSTLLYLCGPASEAVTGTVIKVDDGQGGR